MAYINDRSKEQLERDVRDLVASFCNVRHVDTESDGYEPLGPAPITNAEAQHMWNLIYRIKANLS